MHTAVIAEPDDFAAFRTHARRLLAACADPATVIWSDKAGETLFDTLAGEQQQVATVPRAFVTLAESVACHRDPVRWPLLYQALWRITHQQRALLENAADPLTHRLNRMAAAVRHDQHRMTAFVRFRTIQDGDAEHYVAWYEPQHYVLRRTAPFFINRFASICFSILTPDLTLHWDLRECRFGSGVSKAGADSPDAMEEGWKRYYAATFNPARNNPDLMARHMPRRFWRNLPEAESIQDLVTGADGRTRRMIDPG